MKYQVITSTSLNQLGEAILIGWTESGPIKTALTEKIESEFQVSLENLAGEAGKTYGKKGKNALIELWTSKGPLKLGIVPVLEKRYDTQVEITMILRQLLTKVKTLQIDVEGIFSKISESSEEKIYRLSETIELATYQFDRYKTEKTPCKWEKIYLFSSVKSDESWKKGQIVAESVNHARDFVNIPAMDVTPNEFAERALEMERLYPKVKVEILDVMKMAEKGMGGILGVGQGSKKPPCCVVISYDGAPKSKEKAGWIGKAVTFDSGGLNLKPGDSMLTMKCDMAGGAAVLFATEAVARLDLPINLVSVIPCAENMPSGSAYRPGDVLSAMNGKTMEIGNTDAEGRLLLVDAICVAAEAGATQFIDVATLTGACVVALGEVATGFCSNNDEMAEVLTECGMNEGEKLWRLPLFEEYRKQIDSDVADLKNVGGRDAGMITAAYFLQEFIPKGAPWCHMDVAGTAYRNSALGISPKAASGEPVRTLVAWAQKFGK